MANERTIKFASIATVTDGNQLSADSFSTVNYPDTGSMPEEKQDEPDTYHAEITEEVKVENSVNTLEGALLIALDRNLIDFRIDINGNLLVLHEQSQNYSINSNGELEYMFN